MNTNLKNNVAREAATLLYFGAEKEYKQAKTRAAKTLGTSFLPSNLEIALELDNIAEENEGANRKLRLIEMRRQALEVMKFLGGFCPLLIGSVWRGTIKLGSDIDIAVYSDNPQEIINVLTAQGVKISKKAWTTVNKHGLSQESFHIYSQTDSNYGLEIVVRAKEEAGKKRKCETFGDEITGLKTQELEKILQNDPAQKFIS
jgi:predicted nucleotidyltransferase